MAAKYDRREEISRARMDIESVTRSITNMVKAIPAFERPLDLEVLSFWAHRIVHRAAINHIKYAQRDQDWSSDLQALKTYLGYYAPSYGYYSMTTSYPTTASTNETCRELSFGDQSSGKSNQCVMHCK